MLVGSEVVRRRGRARGWSRGCSAKVGRDESGRDETTFLKPLQLIAETGITPAEEMLMRFDREWGGKVDQVYSEYAY